MGKVDERRHWPVCLFFIIATFLFAFYEDAYAAQAKELPIFNSSFEDWNDSYPLSVGNYTTSVPTGWDLNNTGYASCDAVVKTHSRCRARTGKYAAFFDSRSYSNALKSNSYKLSEGSYTFSVYAATIGYEGTKLTLKVDGAVNKSQQYSVTESSYSYTKYSLSFNMESEGEVRFWIDNSQEWDGNSTISHFAIDDWSLTTSDGALLDFNSSNVYEDGNYIYYLYNNGTAELAVVTNKDISGEITIPETIYVNNTQYIVRSISPYAFSDCNKLTSIIFPKRLYAIGKNSFENCRSLNSVLFPTYLQLIDENAFVGCENLHEAVFMTKAKPSISSNAFGSQVKLYVPKIADYRSFGDRVEGLAYINEDILYTGVIPNLNLTTPASVSITSLNKESLKAPCGKYILPASFAYNGMTVEGEIVVSIQPTSLKIIAPNLRRQFGENNPIIALTYEGFVNGETPEVLLVKPTISLDCYDHSDVGDYAIVLTNGAATNYSINYIQGSLKIEKRDLKVQVKNAQISYGQDLPEFQLFYEGLANFENVPKWDKTPQFTTVATKGSNVGEYSVSVNCEPHNYNIVESINGNLLISKAPLILRAKDITREYYEENPSFDFTLIGLRNSDTKSCLSMQPSFKCAAVKTSNSGEYEIEPLNATAQNYTIDYQKGTLSINKRALTASVGNYTKIYGSENPQFEIEYTGFVNNEDKSVLTNTPNIVCSANKSSDVGSYPIFLDGGEAMNYVINKYNSGTLTIEKANQAIIWNQDLSNIPMYSQVALEASSSAHLPITYELSPNNVASLYNNNGTWYLDCFGSGAVNIRAVQNGDKNYNAAPMVSNTLVVMGTGGEPSNPQIFLNIDNAGTLPNLIADNRKYQIKNLRLTGYLNGTDINFLREMAGSDSYGNSTLGILEILDISGCTIVSGGRSYYKSCQTSNNKVGDYMFYNCKQLVNLMLPENTTEIEDYAFADCDRLSVISIPDGVKSFGVQSFRNDISLLRIPMPRGLISIKDYAFMGCNGLSEITISASVINIGDGIVKDCQNISKINVAESNNYFASENGVLYTSTFDELLIFPVNYESNSYAIKEGTKIIAPYAFVNSKRLCEVILPSTLTNIGEDAFIGCVNISSLQVKALNPPVCSNDCFEAVSKTRCELIVPPGCYNYYWVAPVWSDFNKIKESDFSDIIGTSITDIEVAVEDHCINIKRVPKNKQIKIFQVDGTLLFQARSDGEDIHFHPVVPDTYLVIIDNKTYKLMVR